ncbi:helix-turn-helix transcriptional regulator [Streptomyces sp. ISL-36]|uniref:helix-turn-helix domain-containing protein n=1 Tax=Streptomyces sp. ISL-36 TaxID=2819182 RepID=UPI0027E5472D|nr:helix-turn-helix transcriptional regulator [Streptomyces sp. ISL-36]
MATETDGFADRVRALKERSGLSYGVLAKKLHVSTSTLHRYGNGDAVPTEFAPVERLGRLCGASREELVELHRSWILADEARRRGKGAPVVSEPEAEPAADCEPRSNGEGQSGGEPGIGPERRSGSGDDPGTVLTVQPPSSPAPSPASAASRRRLRTVLAAAAVVALAVPLWYAVGSPDDDGGGARGAAGTTTTPPVRGHADAPVNVGISAYNWAAPCGQYYVLDQRPGQVPPPPPPQDTRPWARALGGVDGGHLRLQLTVTGRTQEAVVLSRLHVRVVERGAPLNQPVYSMGEGCGSGVTPQTFDIDLDAPLPFVKPVAGQDGDLVVPAKDFPYKVSTGDPQILNLDVHTEAHVAAWYLELDWSSGEQHGTLRVDDGGKPFRTSAVEGKTMYDYWPDKGEWVVRS